MANRYKMFKTFGFLSIKQLMQLINIKAKQEKYVNMIIKCNNNLIMLPFLKYRNFISCVPCK